MFHSIIDDADISCNAKMQHLQNAVVGRAKEAIEGYGYSGELYAEALEKLESRFGKSHIVVSEGDSVAFQPSSRTPLWWHMGTFSPVLQESSQSCPPWSSGDR